MSDSKERAFVLAVDPGKMSGLAFVSLSDDAELRQQWSIEVDETEYAGPIEKCLKWYKEYIASGGTKLEFAIVCETFTITAATARNTQAPWSLKNIGILEHLCRQYDYPIERIAMQSPANAKNVVSNEKLKRLELWHKGGDGHANDALRHAVLYFITRGWTNEKLLR